jgi:hypothetical protein
MGVEVTPAGGPFEHLFERVTTVHRCSDKTSTDSRQVPHRPCSGNGAPARHTRGMRKAIALVLGGLLTVVGLIWTLQGLGYLTGSPMTGVAFWAIVGPIVAGLGVAAMIVGYRGPR